MLRKTKNPYTGNYPSYPARPPTPFDPQIAILKSLIYPAKPTEKKFGRLDSFNIFSNGKHFLPQKRSLRTIVRTLSVPNLNKMKELSIKG